MDGELAQAEIEKEQRAREAAVARDELLRRLCTPEALERIKRVKLVKLDLVDKVERYLEQQALSGKIRSQITENDIVELLTKVGTTSARDSKITIARKRYGNDDDDDDDDSDLR